MEKPCDDHIQFYVENFEEFEKCIKKIRTRRSKFKKDSNCSLVSELLFRGQGDASWKLETTLERRVRNSTMDENLGASNYYEKILDIRPRVEFATNQSWKLESLNDYKEGLVGDSPWDFLVGKKADRRMEMYQYFAYLRHHNFPSPLLDWTQCEYVAAFFAFRRIEKCAKKVAVYLFLEDAGSGKSGLLQSPHIHGLGHNVQVHTRHIVQKSQYTLCTVKKTLSGEGNAEWYYAEHDKARREQTDSKENRQDLLWKIELPLCSRDNFLTRLDALGINEDNLFRPEDVLMETLTREVFPCTPSS